MGAVTFYNGMSGFGFIQHGDKDVFIHTTALERYDMRGLCKGLKVAFDTADNCRSGKIAVNSIQSA